MAFARDLGNNLFAEQMDRRLNSGKAARDDETRLNNWPTAVLE